MWWHEVDDDDYNGDNNRKLCENNEPTNNKNQRINQPTNSISILKWFNHFTWNCQMHVCYVRCNFDFSRADGKIFL